MSLYCLGAHAAKPSTSYARTRKRDRTWWYLLGGPAVGALIGGTVGRTLSSAFIGGAAGAALGLAGCTAENPEFGKGGEEDGGTPNRETTLDMPPQEDMTSRLDMSKPSCIGSLGGVGTKDFTISFDLVSRESGPRTVIHQRKGCSADECFWDIEITDDGTLIFLNGSGDGTYSAVKSDVFVNDAREHSVVVRRVSGTVAIVVDGTLSGEGSAPASMSSLPPIGMERGNPCETAGLRPLVGYVRNACFTLP